jgi:23S rRNA (pseudouridine1915-N3)-methyltransferase
MQMTIVAVGKSMPAWVTHAFQEYAKRLPRQIRLNLIEIPLTTRSKNSNIAKLMQKEAQLMLQAIPANHLVIALDVQGKAWDTPTLAKQLNHWLESSTDVCLLIGGPEGLTAECVARADYSWSLSPLTFPHPLVRIILIEQLYRAWTLLIKHPYHR